jgi:hypothetical protein
VVPDLVSQQRYVAYDLPNLAGARLPGENRSRNETIIPRRASCRPSVGLWSCAAHRRRGRAGRPGRPGILYDIDLPRSSATLPDGDVLALYTDGVTEVRYRTSQRSIELFGEERLRSPLTAGRGTGAADIAGRVETAVQEFQSVHSADDLAVLVLRVTGGI